MEPPLGTLVAAGAAATADAQSQCRAALSSSTLRRRLLRPAGLSVHHPAETADATGLVQAEEEPGAGVRGVAAPGAFDVKQAVEPTAAAVADAPQSLVPLAHERAPQFAATRLPPPEMRTPVLTTGLQPLLCLRQQQLPARRAAPPRGHAPQPRHA